MSDGFDEMSPELKQEVKSSIIFYSDTGACKVFIKNCVQEDFPDLDKRAIYRTIKEMLKNGELFYSDSGLIKSSVLCPNAAKTGRKSKRKRK